MQSKIEAIINSHSDKMKLIDTTKSIPLIVKELDGIAYDMYREIYGLRDIRHDNYCLNNITVENKKGHCC